jgi:hypothetical protein
MTHGAKLARGFVDFSNVAPDVRKPEDRDVIYQLRNAPLHSFGLYSSKDGKEEYRFFLTAHGNGPLVSPKPVDQYYVDLRVLYGEFEKAVTRYQDKLNGDSDDLQKKFTKMFRNYGCRTVLNL